ncbi:MAG TPA: putative O-glycosylation ligase, exosortase A system-associated [Rhizomicrobium sp.]|nr:putative O-glycosylation ligase, exosortase A system-associated [Rhizomicrobium sp.]
MRDIFLLLVALAYAFGGTTAPFVFGLGYLWTDYFNPQLVAYSFMRIVPVSLLMALSAALAYLLSTKQPTKIVPGIWLLIVWAAWITLTTTWAEVPEDAWPTWDWSFKTVCFAAFLPFLFKSRVQLEAMLLTIAIGVSGSLLAYSIKTLVSGGRYGASLSLIGGNSGLGEEATLACVAIAIIPILLHYHRHSLLIKNRFVSLGLFYGLSAAAVVAALGTFERTGLIALIVFAVLQWWNTRRKLSIGVAYILLLSMSGYLLSDSWFARMETIQHPQGDVSAMGRLAVWAWDIDYAMSHPWGGGFNVFEINHISIPIQNSPTAAPKMVEQSARAPHSIYFQVLSEHGIVGALIFAVILTAFFANVRRIRRKAGSDHELDWASSLARSLSASGIIYLCGGAFTGIAFQPFLYDLIAAGVILNQIMRNLAATNPAQSATSTLGGGAQRRLTEFPNRPVVSTAKPAFSESP